MSRRGDPTVMVRLRQRRPLLPTRSRRTSGWLAHSSFLLARSLSRSKSVATSPAREARGRGERQDRPRGTSRTCADGLHRRHNKGRPASHTPDAQSARTAPRATMAARRTWHKRTVRSGPSIASSPASDSGAASLLTARSFWRRGIESGRLVLHTLDGAPAARRDCGGSVPASTPLTSADSFSRTSATFVKLEIEAADVHLTSGHRRVVGAPDGPGYGENDLGVDLFR